MYYIRTVKMGEVVVAPLLDLVVWKCTCCVVTCPSPALHVIYLLWACHVLPGYCTARHVYLVWACHVLPGYCTARHVYLVWACHALPGYYTAVLFSEIQSHPSSTRRALRTPRPENTGLRNGARRKLE